MIIMMTISKFLVVLMLVTEYTEGQSRGGSCVTQDGQQGTCIALGDCEELRNLLTLVRNNTAPSDSTEILRRAICHFDNNEPLVCCPITQIATPAPSPSMDLVSNGTSVSVLPESCGKHRADFYIDGFAPLRAWPWIVNLRGTREGRSSWFCGGTLISKRYVLTAAHCFLESFPVNLEFARIGEHNLDQPRDCEFGLCGPPPQDIPVESIILHPSFRSPCSLCNDIALLRLSHDATIDSNFVTPICLPLNPSVDMGFSVPEFQGKFAWAAGWGDTTRDPNVLLPSILQQVQLPIQELDYCNRLRNGYPDPSMTICAGGDGGDLCRGDSGVPLILANTRNTVHFIVGIASSGPFICGAEGTQGLYTSVHYYLPWIIDTMRP